MLTPEARVLSRFKLLLRAISGSMALEQPGSKSTSVAQVATKSHVAAQGIVSHLGLCWCPKSYAASRVI